MTAGPGTRAAESGRAVARWALRVAGAAVARHAALPADATLRRLSGRVGPGAYAVPLAPLGADALGADLPGGGARAGAVYECEVVWGRDTPAERRAYLLVRAPGAADA